MKITGYIFTVNRVDITGYNLIKMFQNLTSYIFTVNNVDIYTYSLKYENNWLSSYEIYKISYPTYIIEPDYYCMHSETLRHGLRHVL